MNKKGIFCVSLTLLILAGCASVGPYVAKKETPPPIKYCNDYTGHTKGSKPFILGGTCCCTPTQKLINAYHADRVCLDLDLDGLIALYKEKGIKTALDHQGCNNLCQWGPHVVKGGKCMVTPTPGTKNYEEVVTGVFETKTIVAK